MSDASKLWDLLHEVAQFVPVANVELYQRVQDALDEGVEQPDNGELVAAIPLNDETRWILGRPNFWCYSVAQVLRQDGHEIETKSEVEQAAVIYWLLNLYLKHGDSWRDVAQLETKRIKAEAEATMQAKAKQHEKN